MRQFYLLAFCLVALLYSSCGIVEGVFKAGMYWGIFLVVAIIGLIIYIISRLGRRR